MLTISNVLFSQILLSITKMSGILQKECNLHQAMAQLQKILAKTPGIHIHSDLDFQRA